MPGKTQDEIRESVLEALSRAGDDKEKCDILTNAFKEGLVCQPQKKKGIFNRRQTPWYEKPPVSSLLQDLTNFVYKKLCLRSSVCLKSLLNNQVIV